MKHFKTELHKELWKLRTTETTLKKRGYLVGAWLRGEFKIPKVGTRLAEWAGVPGPFSIAAYTDEKDWDDQRVVQKLPPYKHPKGTKYVRLKLDEA